MLQLMLMLETLCSSWGQHTRTHTDTHTCINLNYATASVMDHLRPDEDARCLRRRCVMHRATRSRVAQLSSQLEADTADFESTN